jgi:hypothetical protein
MRSIRNISLCLLLGLSTVPAESTDSGHERMRAALKRIADHPPDGHWVFPTLRAELLQRKLEEIEELARAGQPPENPFTPWRLNFDLGQALVRSGKTAKGIRYLQQAHAVLRQLELQFAALARQGGDPQQLRRVQLRLGNFSVQTSFYLGISNLRLGEDQNCSLQSLAEACILPLQGKGIHTKQEGSRSAVRYFHAVLEHPYWRMSQKDAEDLSNASGGMSSERLGGLAAPNKRTADQLVHFREASRWLLNLAYMTLGEYPDSVPGKHLVSPEVFATSDGFPRFENVGPKLGLDTFNLCGGAIVDDFDGDGNLDIVTSTWDLEGEMRFFRSRGDGTFADETGKAGLTGFFGGLNMVQADYDNDGDTDIFVLRGAWLSRWGRHPNSLLSNNGDGSFTDVTYAAGLAEVNYPTKSASWGDYDNDGNLDLFVVNETDGSVEAPSQLFRNNGDGSFTDVAQKAGVRARCFGMGTVWGDYDDDGFLDLYVGDCQPAKLFHNNGDGTFTDVARHLGVRGPRRPFAAWFWDFDNDSKLDLLVNASSGSVGVLSLNPLGVDVVEGDPSRRPLQQSVDVEVLHLYQNDGKGGFREVAKQRGLTYPSQPMGANFGDLNNDGFLDFYLATGDVFYSELRPNVMFLNRGGTRFENVTMSGGFGHLQKGHGVSFADLDNDGDQDIYVQMGGAYPGDKYNDALFENPGFDNRWLTIKLEGRASNRSAIGARIHVRVRESEKERSIYRHVNSGGSFGCNPLRQTVGLGKADEILLLEISWPTTGETQRFADVELDQAIRIIEGDPTYARLQLARFKIGGTSASGPPAAEHQHH